MRPTSLHHFSGIGHAAANRLVALANIGVDLSPDLTSIRTVGDMKRLVERCSTDHALDAAIRNALSVPRSAWTKAKQAAVAAVEPDAR